jgi:hypothetical protein
MWTLEARIAVVDVYVKQPSTAVARVKGKVDVLRHEHGGTIPRWVLSPLFLSRRDFWSPVS